MGFSALIVDDSVVARAALKTALDVVPDRQIYEASNGMEAIQLCQTRKFDVVFLDLLMPNMNGYEVLSSIRKAHLACPVIVVSANIQPEAWNKAKLLGAVDFIAKPFGITDVLLALDRHGIGK